MKKVAALFLSLTLLFSVSSCIAFPSFSIRQTESMTAQDTSRYDSTPNDTPPTNPESDQSTPPSPSEIIESNRYYKIEKAAPFTARYTIYNAWGDEVFSATTDRPLSISMLGKDIVDIEISMGTGSASHRYYHVYDLFSNAKEYTQVIASSSDYVAYLDGSIDDRKVVVKSIFDDTFYKEFELELDKTPMPVISASLSHDALYMDYNENSEAWARVRLPLFDLDHDVFADYNSLVQRMPDICSAVLYYDNYIDYAQVFDITAEQEIEQLNHLLGSLQRFSLRYEETEFIASVGYDIKDLNGDGIDELVLLTNDYEIIAIFTTVDERPYLLDHYWERKKCSIGENGIISVSGSGGADVHLYETYRIADDGRSLELILSFGLDGHEWVGDVAVQKYYKMVNGEKIAISEAEFDALYAEHPFRGKEGTEELSGLTFTPITSAIDSVRETADQAYRDVLANKIKVYHTQTNESCYLANCKTPYMQAPLYECADLGYALVDLDGDLTNELVISCDGDTLILRYYEGTVYLYSFIFRNLYDLCTDGSYYWNHNGVNFEYGRKQLYFVGATLKSIDLWCVVNDGEPNAAYYIGDRQVTQTALMEYIDAAEESKVTFAPFDFEASKRSPEEALTIAENYWSRYEIEKNGYIVMQAHNDDAPTSVYVFVIKWLVMDHHYSTFDEIWINAYTGEAIIPYSSNGK